MGWHVTRPLALDASASQLLFGYQPVFNLSWYESTESAEGTVAGKIREKHCRRTGGRRA
jgi:hypothetical protein